MLLVVIGAIRETVRVWKRWFLAVWTGVDFSVCVVAPPGERSVGAAKGKRVSRGRQMR